MKGVIVPVGKEKTAVPIALSLLVELAKLPVKIVMGLV